MRIGSPQSNHLNHLQAAALKFKPRLFGPTSVARDSQDVAGATLGEVRPGLVDPGLHDDRALPPVHAALDGAGDADLQPPLLTAEETEDTGSSTAARGRRIKNLHGRARACERTK